MVITDYSLQYLENSEVDKKKVLLSGIVGSMGFTYVGEKQYNIDTLFQTFEYFVLSQSTLFKKRLSATKISTLTKITSKWKQLYSHSLFSSSAIIISMCINFRVGRFVKMHIFFFQ